MSEKTQSILFGILTFFIIITSGFSAYLIFNKPVNDIEIQSSRFERIEIQIEPQKAPIPQKEPEKKQEDDRLFHFKLGPFELNKNPNR